MTQTTQLQAVVFDLDGLMFNTEELYDVVGETLLECRGHRFSRELKDAMTGLRGPEALQVMIDRHKLDATVEQLQAETDEIFPQILAEKLAPLPGLFDLIEALESADIDRAIATSSKLSYTRRILEPFDLESRFQFVLTAENVQQGKPHPEIYLTAADRLSLSPDQLMVLEDSENGCRSAVNAGAFTVAVPGDHSRHHDFTGVEFVAESLADRRIYQALNLQLSC